MDNLIELLVGDTSSDGHCQVRSHVYESNFAADEVREAFDRGSDKVGFNLVEDVATCYDDNEIPAAIMEKLVQSGYDVDNLLDPPYITDSEWADLYMWIAKYGDDELEYELAQMDAIWIGGYGLFY